MFILLYYPVHSRIVLENYLIYIFTYSAQVYFPVTFLFQHYMDLGRV